MKKFLLGRGLGWSTLAGNREEQEFLLFYKPFIEHIEKNGNEKWSFELCKKFEHDYHAKFNKYFIEGNLDELIVAQSDSKFLVFYNTIEQKEYFLAFADTDVF